MSIPRPPTNIAHTIRVPDALWAAAMARAADEGETVSAIIRRALRDYTKPAA